MREVFGAVVVIGIVLVAVFVPVAFFPGTTGRMYQQFSITIAFAVILSVFNAVTLTPALSALLLDRPEARLGRFFSLVNRVIKGGTRVYARIVRGLLRWEWAMLAAFGLAMWATWTVYQMVPSSFVPDEDEGYFISIIQAPAVASLQYTTEIARQAEQIILAQPEVLATFSVAGFSFSGSAPNQGLMFTRLLDYAERQDPSQSLAALLGRLQGMLIGGIPGALVIPVAPPSIQGLSAFGGFQFQVLDGSGGPIENLASTTQQLIAAGNQSGRVTGLFSSFTADDPQLVVDIDRDRARSLGLPMSAVTDTLQVPAGVAIRQRLRLQQSCVPGLCAGRQPVSRRAGRAEAVLRPRVQRPDGARGHGRHPVGDDRADGHQPLQHVPIGRDRRRRRRGRQLGAGHPDHGAAGCRAPTGWFQPRVGGPGAGGDSGGVRRRRSSLP